MLENIFFEFCEIMGKKNVWRRKESNVQVSSEEAT